jgi:hypothetical protein
MLHAISTLCCDMSNAILSCAMCNKWLLKHSVVYIDEYHDIPGSKDGRCLRVTTLPPSCAVCLEILEP